MACGKVVVVVKALPGEQMFFGFRAKDIAFEPGFPLEGIVPWIVDRLEGLADSAQGIDNVRNKARPRIGFRGRSSLLGLGSDRRLLVTAVLSAGVLLPK